VVDFESDRMTEIGAVNVHLLCSAPPSGPTALTVFTQSKASDSLSSSRHETRHTEQQSVVGPYTEAALQSSSTWLVRTTGNVTVAPLCRQVIVGKLESEKGQKILPLVCVETAQIPIQGILI
jgi:hypothetical protein